ncbi:hypothetical protein D3C73_1122070 [compost metagenome]
MQGATAQLAQAQAVSDFQLTCGITELAALAAIEVELQKAVFLRQARQRIWARHLSRPQHQMLAGAIAQRPLWGQSQAQYVAAQPIDGSDFGRTSVLQRIEGVHLQILDHLTLTRQAPALLALLDAQCIGPTVAGQALTALHQARMTTSGATAIGHGHAVLIQGIEQVAARCHRPPAIADPQLRHRHSPRPPHNDCAHRVWPDRAPGRRAARRHRDRHPAPAGSCRPTG